MKLSNSFFFTRREFPSNEQTISTKLLIKSGMILKNNNGVYTYLPLGLKAINNIKNIIRNELNKIYATEILTPSLIYSEDNIVNSIFDESETFRIIDRNNKSLDLCSSSEELFSYLASQKIQSYKDLHFSLFQISNKFRDEESIEYGLIRKKEFLTMDAYSYDADDGGLEVSYDKMFLAFRHIFNKLGLETLVVENNDEDFSEEFQVISEYGDNEIVKCNTCTYACNIENASSKSILTSKEVSLKPKELVKTVNIKTIDEVSEYLNVFKSNILKSLICKVDGVYKMILLKGNSELNVKKLMHLFNTTNIEIPSSYELEKIGTSVGYIGPIDCTMQIIADNEVKTMHNFICGSNRENYHYKNVNIGRDFKVNMYADLKLFDKYSLCPKCKNKCSIIKGVEVGQIRKIGNNNSKEYNLKYTDEVNKENFVHIGSYQIGIDRCLSAIVEKNHDENGIIWPISVAPYKVSIVVSNINDKEILKYATSLHDKLEEMGIDVLLDDRKESIGVKFNDMDLIGIPIRVTVGKLLQEEKVELKNRQTNETKEINTHDLIYEIKEMIKEV